MPSGDSPWASHLAPFAHDTPALLRAVTRRPTMSD